MTNGAEVRRRLLMTAVLLLVGSGLLALPQPAWGHAFEVDTRPLQGARLAAPPDEIVLQFTEPVEQASAEVNIRLSSGEPAGTGEMRFESDSRVLRVPLLEASDGIYVADWRVIATIDGHVTAGQLAFAAGSAGGDIPAREATAQPLRPLPLAASWLLLAGFGLAAGGLVLQRFLPVPAPVRGLLRTLTRLGLLAAVTAALAHLLLSGLTAPSTNSDGLTALSLTRADLATALTAVFLLIALVTTAWRHRPGVSLLLVAAAGFSWAARSHAGVVAGDWAAAVDSLHLLAAGTWVGSLVGVTFALWSTHRQQDETGMLPLVAAYARLALPLVALTVLTGIIAATQLLTGLDNLVASAYGQTLSVKTVLVLGAIAVAALAHFRGLPSGKLAELRRMTTTESGALAAVLLGSALLINLGPPAAVTTGDVLLGPPPIEGPVVRSAGLAGNLTVVVTAGKEQLRVDVTVPSGVPDGVEVALSARSPDGREASLHPRPCGAGCYVQELELPDGATELVIDAGVAGGTWTGGRYTAALHWPPPANDPQLLRDLVRRMREAPSLRLSEQVSSGPGASPPAWTTTLTGEQYVELAPYAAGEAVDVRPLPRDQPGLTFAMPGSRLWFELVLDSQGRVAHERIVSPGHEINRNLTYPAST